jgi:hypothetical protein
LAQNPLQKAGATSLISASVAGGVTIAGVALKRKNLPGLNSPGEFFGLAVPVEVPIHIGSAIF